jgi:ABC-type nitrate/sulfonate/bicarbonate transport system substrate-binding protein
MELKWRIVTIALIVVFAVPLVYYFVYIPSLPPQNVKIAVPIPVENGYWEFSYANYTNLYMEQKLAVEIQVMRNPQEAMQALIAGDVHFVSSIGDSIRTYLGGSDDLRIVLVVGRPSFGLWVHPEIESFQDIEIIATAGRGSDGDVMIREHMLSLGLDPETDITIQNLNFPALMPAFLNDEVDAITIGTGGYTALNQGKKMLFHFAEKFPQWCTGGLVTTQTMIDEKPDVVKAMVKAVYQSQVHLKENKNQAIAFAVDEFGFEQDHATFLYEFMYEGTYGAAYKILPVLPIADLEYTMGISAQYTGADVKPIAGVVDSSFYDQVKSELGD